MTPDQRAAGVSAFSLGPINGGTALPGVVGREVGPFLLAEVRPSYTHIHSFCAYRLAPSPAHVFLQLCRQVTDREQHLAELSIYRSRPSSTSGGDWEIEEEAFDQLKCKDLVDTAGVALVGMLPGTLKRLPVATGEAVMWQFTADTDAAGTQTVPGVALEIAFSSENVVQCVPWRGQGSGPLEGARIRPLEPCEGAAAFAGGVLVKKGGGGGGQQNAKLAIVGEGPFNDLCRNLAMDLDTLQDCNLGALRTEANRFCVSLRTPRLSAKIALARLKVAWPPRHAKAPTEKRSRVEEEKDEEDDDEEEESLAARRRPAAKRPKAQAAARPSAPSKPAPSNAETEAASDAAVAEAARAAPPPAFTEGQAVMVDKNRRWYPAKIAGEGAARATWHIHYEDGEEEEDVPLSRINHPRPPAPGYDRRRATGVLGMRLLEKVDPLGSGPKTPRAPAVPRPKRPASTAVPLYEWSPGDDQIQNFEQMLSKTWTPANVAAQQTWLPQLKRFGTAHFTKHGQGGFREAEEARDDDRDGEGAGAVAVTQRGDRYDPSDEEVSTMLQLALAEANARRELRLAASVRATVAATQRAKEKVDRKRDAENEDEVVRTELASAKVIKWRDRWNRPAKALPWQKSLRGVGNRTWEGNHCLVVTVSDNMETREPCFERRGADTFPGTKAEWLEKFHNEKPGGENPTDWGRRAYEAWKVDSRNPTGSDDPQGTARLPFQKGYAPLKKLLAPSGNRLLGTKYPLTSQRHSNSSVVPHRTNQFTPIEGETNDERPSCGQAALQHLTQHSLKDLGIDVKKRPIAFDREHGLANVLRNATTPLGRSFALAKSRKDLDTATTTRDAERLVIYCYHGYDEDVRTIYEKIANGEVGRICEAFPLGFELIGHYVVYDTSLGILYLEPEVYIVSEAERRDPSLLREALMRPPYQLLFERGPSASSHTRLLTLNIDAGASEQSNYYDPVLLKRMRADYKDEQRRINSEKRLRRH